VEKHYLGHDEVGLSTVNSEFPVKSGIITLKANIKNLVWG